MATTIEINGRQIGSGKQAYVIAELSANHNGNFDQAMALVQAASKAGADAVKLQTYTPDTITMDSDKEYFRIGGGTVWDGQFLYELYRKAYTPWEWQPRLKERANELGMDLFSSAFDSSAVDFLEEMNVPAHKVASCELVDTALIEKIARTQKPLILSTGMATLQEIERAIQAATHAGAEQIALLKCTSAYPAPPDEMNLRTIPHLIKTFHVPVGLSDHTLNPEIPVAAVALGACIIEKHLTLSRSIPGPDSAFSLEPEEFQAMVKGIRVTETALGLPHYGATQKEKANRAYRRSLFVVMDVKQGEVFTESNVRSIRPANGLSPEYLPTILGKRAVRDLERGTPLSWDLIAE